MMFSLGELDAGVCKSCWLERLPGNLVRLPTDWGVARRRAKGCSPVGGWIDNLNDIVLDFFSSREFS